MFDTAFTLSLTQFARSLSFPERLQHRPMRNAALEFWRLRNTGLDALFYDIKALSAEETFYISDAIAAEGLIMIVPPTGGGMLTLCDSVDEYLLRGGRDVHVLAVAGIGGSAAGAAAFARNVADAVGAPVAAVVSGYGLGDILTEAMGGAFFFGPLGFLRNDLEVIDDMVGRPHFGAYRERHLEVETPRRASLDADTVETLLAHPDLRFTLLTGHSKGNLVLSEALYALKQTAPERLATLGQKARIVTFGARITMPPAFADVVDVLGEFDWYGELNSRPRIETDLRVPRAGHSTNTDLPLCLMVTRTLKEILGPGTAAVEPAQDTSPVEAPLAVAPKAVRPAETVPVAASSPALLRLVEQPVPPVNERAVADEPTKVEAAIEAVTETELAAAEIGPSSVAEAPITNAGPDLDSPAPPVNEVAVADEPMQVEAATEAVTETEVAAAPEIGPSSAAEDGTKASLTTSASPDLDSPAPIPAAPASARPKTPPRSKPRRKPPGK
ncbi:cell envelope biogenesis protein OmpA [Rhizobium sp. CG5]|uniref:cell envelope biogenesis protein OmpA n=1 Tax=Rhizobium sp. CG5 TaxID=2726076 RepID=UPI002033FC2F|nr:cell envelope biogenesis protein OmpA [Rhizobium sp. CG5]MCM2477457.1 cell envelope biogenesis protein OmpA [Rhizobium sp. CG5]